MNEKSPKLVSNHLGEIAIIGMAGRFPGADDLDSFWSNLRAGTESIRFFTPKELAASGVAPEMYNNPGYVPARGSLDDIELFDAGYFGISPREAESLDPQHRLFLECALTALHNAGYDSHRVEDAIGVFAGCSMSSYMLNLFSNPEVVAAVGHDQAMLGNDKDFLATRVSYKLNLRGPSLTVQTACSTGLTAVHLACQSLLSGECDMALAGAVSLAIPEKEGYLYEEQGILSPDGHCRAFDAQAAGTVSGSGVGVVTLKPMDDALRDGDCILAVIKGSAINNDGSAKVSYTAPSVQAQARVIAEALEAAQVDPRQISYVEAHGTGTTLGDPVEIAALTRAFRAFTADTGFCACGSVKTNIGHLDAAAGLAGLIKTVLCLRHRELPPSLHFQEANPNIDFAGSPFFVNDELREWPAGKGMRCAGVSSLGIGGTNVHVIVEEAPARTPAEADPRPCRLVVLSAHTPSALEEVTRRLADHLGQHPEACLDDIVFTCQVGRTLLDHRRVLVCRDRADAIESLTTLPTERILGTFGQTHQRPVAFLFPGQGAQYAGMGREIYRSEPLFRREVDRCAEVLQPLLEQDLRAVLFAEKSDVDSHAQIDETCWTQPALFVIEYALAKLWTSWGIEPRALIGHSIGEYVAACLAGVFKLSDALRLVAARGQLMQSLPRGSMLVVPLSEAEILPRLGNSLDLAAVNGAALCTASGADAAITVLEKQLANGGVSSRRIPTSHAFHSAAVNPILEEFEGLVAGLELAPPKIPVVSNLTGTWLTDSEATDPAYWRRHLRETVRFADGLVRLAKEQDLVLLEVGPGKALTSLARQSLERPQSQALVASMRYAPRDGVEMEHLQQALGRLWLAGVSVDWQGFHRHHGQRQRSPLPAYPLERRRFWVERNADAYVLAAGAVSKAQTKKPIAEWFYTPVWKQSAPRRLLDATVASGTSWMLFSDCRGLGSGLAQRLQQSGAVTIEVSAGEVFAAHGPRSWTIDPRRPADYDALIRELASTETLPNRIVHLWSIDAPGATPLDRKAFDRAQQRGFYSLLWLARALGQHRAGQRIEIFILSNDMQAVAGEATLAPQKATVLGLCTVIPQEFPNLVCRSLDLHLDGAIEGTDNGLLDDLMAEVLSPGADAMIAYRSRQRFLQIFEKESLPAVEGESPRLRRQGVYLIFGGLGQVGLSIARFLARSVQARLLLAGRSVPAGNARYDLAALGELQELGSEVEVVAADITDAEQAASAVALAEKRFGVLHGVVHAAASTRMHTLDLLSEIDSEACERHFAAKVHGTLILGDLLEGRSLDFAITLSSLSTVLGGVGLAPYAAANLFLDAFAEAQHRRGERTWLSIDWDAWSFEEANQEAGGQMRRIGAGLEDFSLLPAEGEDALGRILASVTGPRIIVSTGDLEARFDRWVRRSFLFEQEESVAIASHERPELQTAYVAPRNELEEALAEMWQELLGIDRVGVHDDFFELGGHSLLGIQVNSRLRALLDLDLPLRSLFENSTIAKLAELIETQLLGEIEKLSEEEAVRLLREQKVGAAGELN